MARRADASVPGVASPALYSGSWTAPWLVVERSAWHGFPGPPPHACNRGSYACRNRSVSTWRLVRQAISPETVAGPGPPAAGSFSAAAQPLQRQERKRSQSAAARVVDSAASRHLLTVRESGAPSLASHAGSRGRGARRMPWESFAVGGPDEAREFWTAAVSDARALPPRGRDGLGGDAGARARARAVAADPSRGRDDRPLWDLRESTQRHLEANGSPSEPPESTLWILRSSPA